MGGGGRRGRTEGVPGWGSRVGEERPMGLQQQEGSGLDNQKDQNHKRTTLPFLLPLEFWGDEARDADRAGHPK